MATVEPTGERLVPERAESYGERVMVARHEFAYRCAKSHLEKGGKILDLGCGTGYGAASLAASGAEVTAVDVSEESIEYARRAHARAGVTFRQLEGARLPFGDETFDLVVSFQVIEHVADDAGFVAEAARVLRRDGALLVTTPNRELRLSPGERPWSRYHVREYDASGLRELLLGAFSSATILGVRASETIEGHEARRVAGARRLARWDPLGLRRLVPNGMRDALIRRAAPVAPDEAPDSALFRLVEDARTGMDLFALACRDREGAAAHAARVR